MKLTRLRIPTMAIAVLVLLVFSSFSGAAHQNVTVRDSVGNPITDGITPYSPKATCGACHNYGNEPASVTHTQGLIESDNNIYWQSYDVSFFNHGVSKGRHSNQGRNEAWNTQMMNNFALPFFTSSPGMFGKF